MRWWKRETPGASEQRDASTTFESEDTSGMGASCPRQQHGIGQPSTPWSAHGDGDDPGEQPSDSTDASASGDREPRDTTEPTDESASEAASSPGNAEARSWFARMLIKAIRNIASEADREAVIRWLVQVRDILGSGEPKRKVATSLYRSINTRRFAGLIGRTFVTAARNYKSSGLPLPVKVALPFTALGMAVFGMQGVGLAAFGGATGMPVVLLLFLGVAGVTAVVEAFIKDESVRDPFTKLLLALIALEVARRVQREFANALRADAMLPERADLHGDEVTLRMQLQTMDPIAFERHTMSYFEGDGFPVGVTPRSNDYGVDGYVVHADGLIVVQCKRYAEDNPVDRPIVQQFWGVIEEQRALRGYVVTTSRFTRGALECAAASNKIVLVDMEALIEWHRHGRKP